MRKRLRVAMVALLLILTVTGCNSREKKDSEANKAIESSLSKGRYMEEDIALPQRVDVSNFISFAVSPKGELELYVYEEEAYVKYVHEDKSWSKVGAEALQAFQEISESDFTVKRVFYGEDQRLYLLLDIYPDYRNALYRLSASGKFEKIEVKRFHDNNEEWYDSSYRPKVLKVLKNGMIVASYPWRVIEVYSPDGQSVIDEYNCGRSTILGAEGNIIYYTDQNDTELLSMNMETKEEGGPRPIEINAFDTGILEIVNGIAYVGNTGGLHLNKEGGSLWETLIDGSQSSLGTPSKNITDFIPGGGEDYYFVLTEREYMGVSIKRIYYDENVSSVPPIELSIFSIDDNVSIRQTISLFQESHPEVRINYRAVNYDQKVRYTYGIKNPEETIARKDHINALNTELLAGRGADILVLDGLPVDSYIEKGVLEDMGSIFTPMRASKEVLPNITAPYFSEDKVYAMPLRFKLPIIYGAADAVNAANSVEELAEYIRNNKGQPVLGPSNYRALAAWLLMTNYDQLLGPNNKIDEAALKNFIEQLQIISEGTHASDNVEMEFMNTNKERTAGYWIASSFLVHKKEIQANIEEIGGVQAFGIPIEVVHERKGVFRAINNSFKANGLIGMNSAGTQKELATEFIQLLFSGEIQRLDLQDGFPVNIAALEEWITHDKEDYHVSVSNGEYEIQASYPEEESRKKIYESICAADRPMVNDMTMMDMLLDETERCLRGDITAEQGAKNAVASINLYLSE